MRGMPQHPAMDFNSSTEEFACPFTLSHHIFSQLCYVGCTHNHTHTQNWAGFYIQRFKWP